MAGVVGLLSSANIPTDLAQKSYAAAITRLSPGGGSAPLFAMTSMLKEEKVVNIEHGFFSKTMVFPLLTLTVAVADGAATTFTGVSTANLTRGDLLRADTTGELVVVDSIVSATQISVTRGFGSVAAAAIANGVTLYKVGTAFEEGSIRPAAVSIIADRYVNYTQIFRNSWAVTETMAAIPQIAGSGQVSESKSECAMFHAVDIESSLFWGQKFMGTRGGQPVHTQEGIIARVTAAAPGNVTTLGATTNWTQLEAALNPVLNVQTDVAGSNHRVVFCGGDTIRVITNICRLNSQYQIETYTSTWGLQIAVLRTPRGTFELVEHRLFNAPGKVGTWGKAAVICDLPAFAVGYLRRTTEKNYNENGTPVDNGIDAQGGTLTTELTSTIKNPAAFGIIYNFTAAAVG